MAAASSTAYSQFSTAKMLHGVQISTAMVQEKQHKIFCFLIKLLFLCVECHTYFENLGTVNHQKPVSFSANATEMRYCLLSLQYIAEGNMLTYIYRA